MTKRYFFIFFVLFLFVGCASTITKNDQDYLYQYSSELFKGRENFYFFALPTMGDARDQVYMTQYKTLGVPTEAAKQISEYLQASQQQPICIALTGASSARAAHIIKEAFSLLPQSIKTTNLQLLFIGEPIFREELKETVESRGGIFFFKEYYPKT